MSDLTEFPDQEPKNHHMRLESTDRLSELEKSGLMDSVPEEVYNRAVRLARQVTGSPVSLLSMVDDKRQVFKAQSGLEEVGIKDRETPLSHSFCQYVVSTRSSLAVMDARSHPLLAANGAVGDLGVIAYLGVPVHGPSGEVLGSFCSIDTEPHVWSDAQLKALEDIAALLESEIRLHRALADRELLVQELHHRVKNLFTVVSGMVRLSRRSGESDEALDARLRALSDAHSLIAPVVNAGDPVGDRIALEALLHTLLTPYGAEHLLPRNGPDVVLGPRASTSLALALHELATNAAKYGGLATSEGTLAVDWRIEGNELHLLWEEVGRSIEGDAAPGGFGSRLITMAIEGQLGGVAEVDFRSDGLTRRIILPRDRLAE